MANHNRHDDLVDAIPMNKTKPTTLLFGLGAAVIVLGTVAFSFMGGKKKSNEDAAQQAPAVVAPTSTLTPEEQKKHLEITRKSLEAFEAQKKQEAEEKGAKAPPPEPPSGGGAPAPAAAAPAGPGPAAAPRPAAAAAPAPAPAKPAKKVSKKDQADLDGLKDIATQLGK